MAKLLKFNDQHDEHGRFTGPGTSHQPTGNPPGRPRTASQPSSLWPHIGRVGTQFAAETAGAKLGAVAFKEAGSVLGGVAGTAGGSFLGPAGAVIGGKAGQFAGSILGSLAGDYVGSKIGAVLFQLKGQAEASPRTTAAQAAGGYAADAAAFGASRLLPGGSAVRALFNPTNFSLGAEAAQHAAGAAGDIAGYTAARSTEPAGAAGKYVANAVKKMLIQKREIGQKKRENLASKGEALPGGGYPIENRGDLMNARRSIGRAKNPAATRALVRRRARDLGVKLPSTFSKAGPKLSKASVDYSPGRGDHRCGNCTHFTAGSCGIVKGPIAPDYWCKRFLASQTRPLFAKSAKGHPASYTGSFVSLADHSLPMLFGPRAWKAIDDTPFGSYVRSKVKEYAAKMDDAAEQQGIAPQHVVPVHQALQAQDAAPVIQAQQQQQQQDAHDQQFDDAERQAKIDSMRQKAQPPKKPVAKLFSSPIYQVRKLSKGGDPALGRSVAPGDASFSISAEIAKGFNTEDTLKHGLVFGWASIIEKDGTIITDHQDDRIEPDELMKAAHDYITNSRQGGVLHDEFGKNIGHVVESMVFTKDMQKALGVDLGKVGWLIGYKIEDPRVKTMVKAGVLKAFSIGGKGRREAVV